MRNLLNRTHNRHLFASPIPLSHGGMTIPWLLKTTRRLCSDIQASPPSPAPFQQKHTGRQFIFCNPSPIVGLLTRINFESLQTIVRSRGRGVGDDGLMAGLDA
jgi:hypothetical protein